MVSSTANNSTPAVASASTASSPGASPHGTIPTGNIGVTLADQGDVHQVLKNGSASNGSAKVTDEGGASSEEDSVGEMAVTSGGHSGADMRDISQYLPLYVIPLSGLENLANLQAKIQQGGDTAGEPTELQEKQITVNIAVPQGASDDVFQMPMNTADLVHEIRLVLSDRETTCHRTSYSLQVDGTAIDLFAEIKQYEQIKDGCTVRLVDEPYTPLEVRRHVRQFLDLQNPLDNENACRSEEGQAPSFLIPATFETEAIQQRSTSMDNASVFDPPEYCTPDCTEASLAHLIPGLDEKQPRCLKRFEPSGWNPPSGGRRLKGDLYYYIVEILEERRFHITASVSGFFVNKSTESEFSPEPETKAVYQTLVDLFRDLSPGFRRNYSMLIKRRFKAMLTPFARVALSRPNYLWVLPKCKPTWDMFRWEDSLPQSELFCSKGYEDVIPFQCRDWNEELQTFRDLPHSTGQEINQRERSLMRTQFDFIQMAVRGAKGVVDGSISPINPADDYRSQLFIWNNIFFSLGFDVKDHFKDLGGDHAAFAAPNNDLLGLKFLTFIPSEEKLYTLGTAVVDYRGYRVTAQTIIPGILEREQDNAVQYGSVDFGKTNQWDADFAKRLNVVSKWFHLASHKIINHDEKELELSTSVELKGIIGNDKRYYILDLIRMFPPDIHFLEGMVSAADVGEAARKEGFPRKFPHKLTSFRPELVDSFLLQRQEAFENAFETNERQNHKQNQAVNGEASKPDSAKQEAEKAAMKDRLRALATTFGSASDEELDIRFNPDIFTPSVRHSDPEGVESKRQKEQIVNLGEFLLTHQIPAFIAELSQLRFEPTLSEGIMIRLRNNFGINVRYLGLIAGKMKSRPDLSYPFTVVVAELISRSAKHLFRQYAQSVGQQNLAAAVSHFLNCMFGSCPSPQTTTPQSLANVQIRKRRVKKPQADSHRQQSIDYRSFSPKTLWARIKTDLQEHYGFALDGDSIDTVLVAYSIRRNFLLRLFCRKVGIQILQKEYALANKRSQAFVDEDIINLFPVVKCVSPLLKIIHEARTYSASALKTGNIRAALDILSDCLSSQSVIQGGISSELALLYFETAQLHYLSDEVPFAVLEMEKAVVCSERARGLDDETTFSYTLVLAIMLYHNEQPLLALRCAYRARYLFCLLNPSTEPHGFLFRLDLSIGVMLHGLRYHQHSVAYLMSAVNISEKLYGAEHLETALAHYVLARDKACRGEFRDALQHQKVVVSIYKKILGENAVKTLEACQLYGQLTEQGVSYARQLNEIQRRGAKAITLVQSTFILPMSHMSICELLSVKNDMRYRVSNITPGLYLSTCGPTPDSDVMSQVAALLGNSGEDGRSAPGPSPPREKNLSGAQMSADDLD
ncbi:Clustered mitochondria protein-like protein [Hypsibius exemplaris]|uniref:Clustered mitochondria protein-like protein n=1 Tax=Hypsibius exemplaris TaxID=2072580 RepID=A0A1W0X2S0_HYPEX|nr:Clustered mitochondria protein-like protein [Hypsibius exemplaris]